MSAPLDLDAIREQARNAVMRAFRPSLPKLEDADRAADAASDVWQAEVDRLRAESVPRSSLVRPRFPLVVVLGWRWCDAKNAPEVWEDGNGCLWCTEDSDHPRLYLNREDTDA